MNIEQQHISYDTIVMVLLLIISIALLISYASFCLGKKLASTKNEIEDDQNTFKDDPEITPNKNIEWYPKMYTECGVDGILEYIPWIDLEWEEPVRVLEKRNGILRIEKAEKTFFMNKFDFLDKYMKDEYGDIPVKEEVIEESLEDLLPTKEELQPTIGFEKLEEKKELEPLPVEKNIIIIDGKNFELTPVS